MSISFNCASCDKKLKVKEELAGKRVRCPECGAVQEVPEPMLEAEESPVSSAPAEGGYAMAPPEPTKEPAEKRRPCPVCGEMILLDAVKCRFCGEIFDETLKRAQQKKRGATAPADYDLGVAEYLVAILCSGIGCIIGIIWMIQGKPKGTKMFGISLAFIVFWTIIRTLTTLAVHH